MSQLLYVLALLACPVGMGLMMWMMSRGKQAPAAGAADKEAELSRLRTEIDHLRIDRAVSDGERTGAEASR